MPRQRNIGCPSEERKEWKGKREIRKRNDGRRKKKTKLEEGGRKGNMKKGE